MNGISPLSACAAGGPTAPPPARATLCGALESKSRGMSMLPQRGLALGTESVCGRQTFYGVLMRCFFDGA